MLEDKREKLRDNYIDKNKETKNLNATNFGLTIVPSNTAENHHEALTYSLAPTDGDTTYDFKEASVCD